MTTVLQHRGTTGHEASAGGDRGPVLAVLDGASQLDAAHAHTVLAYAQMVSVVEGRPLRVLLVRPRLGFTTDAAVVAARRRRRRQVMAWLSTRSQAQVEIDELTVPRRISQRPADLWDLALVAARERAAACVVVSEQMPTTHASDRTVTPAHTTPTVITVLARAGGSRSQDHRSWS